MKKAKSGIHIKPSKKGTFTAAAKKHGKSVQGFASQVLGNKEKYSPAMVKKANFARNASKWKKGQDGMNLRNMPVDLIPSAQPNDLASTQHLYTDPFSALTVKAKKKRDYSGTVTGALALADAVIPHEKLQPLVLPIQPSYNPFPYGTGSQAIYEDGGCMDCGGAMQKGGKVSRTGYRRSSKDRNQPTLRIPSNQISMQDVPHPVIGVDNTGFSQMMMPERNYAYPGTYVDEYPIHPPVPNGMQAGGTLPGQTGMMYARYAGAVARKVQDMESGGYMVYNPTEQIDYNPPQSRNYGGFVGNDQDEDDMAKSGKWIQKAVNPAHKGYCTPMTKSTCTPRRKAFARTMKKHHGFHEDGGELQAGQRLGKAELSRYNDPYAPGEQYPAMNYNLPLMNKGRFSSDVNYWTGLNADTINDPYLNVNASLTNRRGDKTFSASVNPLPGQNPYNPRVQVGLTKRFYDGGEVAVGQGGDVNIRQFGGEVANGPYNPFFVESWDGKKAQYPKAGYGSTMQPILYNNGGSSMYEYGGSYEGGGELPTIYEQNKEYNLSHEQIRDLISKGYKLKLT